MSTIKSQAADARRSPRFVPLTEKPPVLLTDTPLGVVQHTDGGEGPAFLALHGGMGGYDQSLVLAEALLGRAPDYRVIALSRPGYLGTPRASGDSAAAQADLFAALLDRLGIERAVVAAVSAGGPSAIAFAARHPERCAGLILVSTAGGRFDVPAYVVKRLRWFGWLVRVPGLLSVFAWLSGRNPEKAAARAAGHGGRDAGLCRPAAAAVRQGVGADAGHPWRQRRGGAVFPRRAIGAADCRGGVLRRARRRAREPVHSFG
ncbi:MAG: Alpha/beta hydrolase [Proteobacteria bacterium]|nr:Alpha/beta hydrolase [Pseudomonadota bacterium]